MITVIIHGQSHKGSTYHIARMLAERIGFDIIEFFLPRDFGEFCLDVPDALWSLRINVHIMKNYLP